MRIERFPGNPLVVPAMDSRIGSKINGPSVIRVPGWVRHPLGSYYMYFAHHDGRFIRLAVADHPVGPWTVYSPGALQLSESGRRDHIASPDVHVGDEPERSSPVCERPVAPGTAGQERMGPIVLLGGGSEDLGREVGGACFGQLVETLLQQVFVAYQGHLGRAGRSVQVQHRPVYRPAADTPQSPLGMTVRLRPLVGNPHRGARHHPGGHPSRPARLPF